MKKWLIIGLIGLSHLVGFSQEFEGGILGGLTANQIDGDSYSGYRKVGLQAGAWARRMFTYTFGGQIEISYIQKGALQTPNSQFSVYDKTTLHNIDIPLLGQYHYREDIIFELGIAPEILIDAIWEDADGRLEIPPPPYNRFSLVAIAGVGYRFIEVMQVHFRFNYSILPIKHHSVGQTWYLNTGRFSNSLTIALYYEFGKR
jgi:hypothetical protein